MRHAVRAILLICLFLQPVLAEAGIGLWEASVIYTDNTSSTVAWDKPEGSVCEPGKFCGYELELRHLEITTVVYKAKVAGLDTVQYSFPYRRSGHYKLFGRTISCDDAALNVNCQTSEWVNSTSDGMVVIGVPSPQNRPWILYWRLPPPGGGGID